MPLFNLLFIHGFDGPSPDAAFAKEARAFKKSAHGDFDVHVHAWNSEKVERLMEIGVAYHVGTAKADEEAERLDARTRELEQRRVPWILVGHSLGCHVIFRMLQAATWRSRWCGGVFFLGAAIPWVEPQPAKLLGSTARIVNYYSPKNDRTLAVAFLNKAGVPAMGAVGAESQERVCNLQCSATHAYKGIGIHKDWSQMAAPIVELALAAAGVPLDASLRINTDFSVIAGKSHWNDVMEGSLPAHAADRRDRRFVVQQQAWTPAHHYRLVIKDASGNVARRLGWSRRIWPLLQEAKFDLRSADWPLRDYPAWSRATQG